MLIDKSFSRVLVTIQLLIIQPSQSSTNYRLRGSNYQYLITNKVWNLTNEIGSSRTRKLGKKNPLKTRKFFFFRNTRCRNGDCLLWFQGNRPRFRKGVWERMKQTKSPTWPISEKSQVTRTSKNVFEKSMNEWVLITTCKQLVWSTRIGRSMPIWILYLILGSGPDVVLSLEVTRCGWDSCSIQDSWATLGRCIYYLSYYYHFIYLSPQDSPSSTS
jgi:hypothetical protein